VINKHKSCIINSIFSKKRQCLKGFFMAEQRTLTLQRGASLTESEFGVLQSLSRSAAASGLYGGIGNEQKILMILLAGNWPDDGLKWRDVEHSRQN
jgi:hypothetical protein